MPLYYYIRDELDEDAELTIEILDAGGNVVRTMSSEEGEQERCELGNEDPRRPISLKYPATGQGLNEWSWDMKSEDIGCIDNIMLHAGYDGPSVMPGEYTARISVGGATDTATFTVANDPRSFATDAEVEEWADAMLRVKGMVTEILQTLDRARDARGQIEDLLADHDDTQLEQWGEAAISAIDEWEKQITQLKHETYEDEDAWPSMLDGQLRYVMDVIDEAGAPVTDGARTRLADLSARWRERQGELRAITDDYIRPINQWANGAEVPHVVSPID
ncbi:MAG: hypothetical protein U5K76_15365 [Woeseiaceae bacterium]|nr:hypothetical protein [Woeseiaceae bacterium]